MIKRKHLTAKHYTILKLFFNSQGDIVKRLDIGLEPMTLVEAHTMKNKQGCPNDWQVVKVI